MMPTVGNSTYTRFTNASAEYRGLVSYNIFPLTNELALLLLGTRVFVTELAYPPSVESSR